MIDMFRFVPRANGTFSLHVFIVNTIRSTELRRMPFSIHKLCLFRYFTIYYRDLKAFRWLKRHIYNMLQCLKIWSAKTRHPQCKDLRPWTEKLALLLIRNMELYNFLEENQNCIYINHNWIWSLYLYLANLRYLTQILQIIIYFIAVSD